LINYFYLFYLNIYKEFYSIALKGCFTVHCSIGGAAYRYKKIIFSH